MNPNLEQLITDIEQELECGLKVYLHKKNLQVVAIPDEAELGYIDDEYWEDQKKELETHHNNYVEIEIWNSSFSFKIMESFVKNIVDDRVLQEKLSEALERAKPFRNFRFILDQYNEYLQRWYRFKSSEQREFVKHQLLELKISE